MSRDPASPGFLFLPDSPRMPTYAVAAVVFACLAAAIAVGTTMSRRVADHHLSSESRDSVKLVLGLMATLAALQLGLLVNSANQSFGAERQQINALAAKIATLTRVLTVYGAEAAGARGELRRTIESTVAQAWPSRGIRGNLQLDLGAAKLCSVRSNSSTPRTQRRAILKRGPRVSRSS